MTTHRFNVILFASIISGSLMSCDNINTGEPAPFVDTLGDDEPSQLTEEEKREIAEREKIVSDSLAVIEAEREKEERKTRTYEARPFAEMLLIDYMKNEVNADAKYIGQVYYIKGEIATISKTMHGDIYFNIGMGHPYQNIQCFVDDASEVENAEVGKRVITKGEFLSISYAGQVNVNVKMDHCTIVNE